jgi:hypothetical protein
VTTEAEGRDALKVVETREHKEGPVKLPWCRILGVEVKTVDAALGPKLVNGTATHGERLSAAEVLLSTHWAQAYAEVRAMAPLCVRWR